MKKELQGAPGASPDCGAPIETEGRIHSPDANLGTSCHSGKAREGRAAAKDLKKQSQNFSKFDKSVLHI